MDQLNGREAGMGCGILALFAIIVAIFWSRTDVSQVTHKLNELNEKVQSLETRVDEISKKLAKQDENRE
jgi:hypothetical protein